MSRSNFQMNPQADLYTKVMLGHVFSHRDDIWVTKTILCTWYIIKTTGRKFKTNKDGIHMLDSNLTLSKFWRYSLLGHYAVRGNNKGDTCRFSVWFPCGSETQILKGSHFVFLRGGWLEICKQDDLAGIANRLPWSSSVYITLAASLKMLVRCDSPGMLSLKVSSIGDLLNLSNGQDTEIIKVLIRSKRKCWI